MRLAGAPSPFRNGVKWPKYLEGDEKTIIQRSVADNLFTLTGPITITVIETIRVPPTSTPSRSSSTETSSSSTPSSTESITTSPESAETSHSPTPTSASQSFPLNTLLPGASTTTSLPTDFPNSFRTTRLSPGAIAGLVVGCIIILCIGTFFTVRKRVFYKRRSFTAVWDGSGGIAGTPPLPEASSEPKRSIVSQPLTDVKSTSRDNYSAAQFQESKPELAIIIPTPTPARQEADSPKSVSPLALASTSLPPADIVFSAIYPPGLDLESPYYATAVCTFNHSLPDELLISLGDELRVLAEYDDGWCLCESARSKKGMVPLECLERGTSNPPFLSVPLKEFDKRYSRRASSLQTSPPK